jgi:hypothetical protein
VSPGQEQVQVKLKLLLIGRFSNELKVNTSAVISELTPAKRKRYISRPKKRWEGTSEQMCSAQPLIVDDEKQRVHKA